jgi:VIT1/CCC1 family predicted Fe2+/Mn2+ transporter
MEEVGLVATVRGGTGRDEPGDPERDLARETERRALLERATVREVLMGAQDNLTNVLAVVMGVTIGAGRAELVALAGAAAAVAEAISMAGVLYTATRAELDLDARERSPGEVQRPARLGPGGAAFVTGLAALAGGLLPLAPFAALPLGAAVATSLAVSIVALFLLGSVTASITLRSWWREGARLILIAGSAALAAALIGAALRVE